MQPEEGCSSSIKDRGNKRRILKNKNKAVKRKKQTRSEKIILNEKKTKTETLTTYFTSSTVYTASGSLNCRGCTSRCQYPMI